MSIQRDYILRMIEMLADLVAGILGLIRKGNYQQAHDALENVFNDMMKEDSAYFLRIPANKITGILLHEHNYSHGHLEILAELLYVQAELYLAEGNTGEAFECYQKSLILNEFTEKESGTFSMDKLSRIEETRAKINNLNT